MSLAAEQPRLVQISPDEYHRDDDGPRLSATTARNILSGTMKHAWIYHPKLGGRGQKATPAMDLGSIVHALLLGKGKSFAIAEPMPPEPTADETLAKLVAGEEVPPAKPKRAAKPKAAPKSIVRNDHGGLEFTTWQTAEAKAAREAILAAGKIPVLPKELRIAQKLTDDIRDELDRLGVHLDGESELAAYWDEKASNGRLVRCRAQFDHTFANEHSATIFDLKVGEKRAPQRVARRVWDDCLDVQAAAYTSALSTVYPHLAGRVRFVFLFAEVHTGLVRVDEMTECFVNIGRQRWQAAIDRWEEALRTKRWPGYAPSVLMPEDWMIEAITDVQHERAEASFYGSEEYTDEEGDPEDDNEQP